MALDPLFEACATYVLESIDNSYDGIVTYERLLRNTQISPALLQSTLDAMIAEKMLCKRDCYAYAVERVENPKSHYGLQHNFNMTTHLTRIDYNKWLNDNANGVGVRLLIFDDAQQCINAVRVADEDAGDDYYRKWYDTNRYSHAYAPTRNA